MPQNKLRVYVHFVWATWDRQPFITEDIERTLHRFIEATCKRHKCRVHAIGGLEDHVHLLVELSNTLTMADLMEFVKGSSSRFVNEQLGDRGVFKWQGSYGAFSVSPHERQKVANYINEQKQRHSKGRLWPAAEQSAVEYDRSIEQTEPEVETDRAVVSVPTKVGTRPTAP
jgi:putative transposase